MRIAGKELRPGREAFIVAEIGINHGGSVSRAIEIVDQLHASGASFDAVKLQYYRTDRLCSSAVPVETRELLKLCELSADNAATVLDHAASLGYAKIVTVFNLDDLNDLRDWCAIDAIKIASPDAVNVTHIYECALTFDGPIIVSTGTCHADETDALAALLKEVAPGRHAMLECVSAYPAEPTFATITYMALKYPDAVIGYSDHTMRMDGGELAACSGARIVEKHVMHVDGQGVDADVSFVPDQFAHYCRWVREKARLVGHGKYAQTSEQETRLSARQSVTLRRDVAAGETIKLDNITVKRPGTGIPAKDWRSVLEAKAARPIKADVPVVWDDLTPAPAPTA
jgi:N,N'-diacetyllegionaminate synthase